MSEEHTIEYVTADGDRHRQTFKTSPNSPASAVVVEEEYRDGAWAGVGLQELQELKIDGELLTPVTGFQGP